MHAATTMAERIVELHAKGRTASQTLPYDAMDAQGWHRRARVVYTPPPSLLASYQPLVSATFAKLCQAAAGNVTEDGPIVIPVGDLGLGLALDEDRQPVVSVEAVALLQLVQTTPGAADVAPEWLAPLQQSWASGQCFFVFCAATGWRGCFAEHRLWSAVTLRESSGTILKTPYAKPVVRSWMAPLILDDLAACVGKALSSQVAATVAEHGYDGAPDLVLYRREPATLWFVEVKSATDSLRENQVNMMKQLSKIAGVHCSVCCPGSALKRMASAIAQQDSSDESQ